MTDPRRLIQLDHAHVWHPFTPMKQWRESDPLVIVAGEGEFLIDAQGRRYIDGVSSLWCNVHGHRVPAIDNAIRAQLDKIAHSTLLGLAGEKSIELAARLVSLLHSSLKPHRPGLSKVFYSDAGATALEAAFKMAVGYWFHTGHPQKNRFIGISGAYHGDTTGSMSVGYSDLFHRPFAPMTFPTRWSPAPDAAHPPQDFKSQVVSNLKSEIFPSQNPALTNALRDHCLSALNRLLTDHAHETAAIVIEPVMQGAAGMICQPPGFLRGVADLAKKYDVLLIADEVATGFGRTGKMFACEHELGDNFRGPDIICLAKGISGGYLPLAATIATDRVYNAFTGELSERKTLYHGHTYTGNPLACAAALASLDLFQSTNLLAHTEQSAQIVHDRLAVLRDHPHILDIRHRGLMVGIELCRDRARREPFDFSKRTAAALCLAMRDQDLIIRPLGDVIVLMPIPAMPHVTLHKLLDIVIKTIQTWPFT